MPGILTGRKGIAAFATGGVLLAATAMVAQAIPSADSTPSVQAKGAALLEGGEGGDGGDSGSLYGKDANTVRAQASTTKMMVATVVLDNKDVDLERKVPVRQQYRNYVAKHHTSTADLQTGDLVTVRQLLYASLLPSGADAAYALADTFGTGNSRAQRVRSFVAQMNTKARALHLDHTTYDTFDGSGKDTSTPAELAKLARHAMQHAVFRKVVKTKKYKGDAPGTNGGTRTYTWTNSNQLLGAYDGVIGIKTGTTSRAGKCLVFAATRDGKTVVGALMDSEDRYNDAAKILDHGFGTDDAEDLDVQELQSDS